MSVIDISHPVRTLLTGQVLKLFSDAEINTQRLQELSNLLGRLKELKIEPLLLKGAGLIKTVYPHPALRPMGDIDILVKPEDFPSLRNCLLQENYQPIPRALGHFSKNTTFHIHIDLHWNIWYLRKDEFDSLWKEGLSFDLNGVQAKTLAPEEHFIYIVVHSIFHHGILDVVRLQDLIRIINHSTNFNWSILVRKTRQYQLETPVRVALEKLQGIQPGIIPIWVLNQLYYRGFNRLWVKLMKDLIQHPIIPHIGQFLKIQAVRGFWGKICYLFSYIFPSELFMKEKYPLISRYPLLLFCYYLHRPVYLTCQGIRLLSGILMK